MLSTSRWLRSFGYFWRKCWQMQMLCKKFLMSEEFEGPHGRYTLEKGLLHVNYALKRFLVDTTWRCTWKLTLDKGLTNEDIEEIVANISPKPQPWRYISLSTAEKSPCEQCVKIVYKLHQDTLEKSFLLVCTILCLLNWNFWWIIMVPHHGGGDMLAQVWSWSENLSTYFTDEIFVVNHLYLLRVTQYTAKRGYKQRLSSETQMTNADVMQHFGRVWRSTWTWHTGEMLSACELCTKAFSSEHTLKMLMKAHAGY